jgi:hypothetical protein
LQKPANAELVRSSLTRQELESNLPVEKGIGSQIDFTHTTSPNPGVDLIVRNDLVFAESHERANGELDHVTVW